MLRYLLSLGFDVNKQDLDGNTPLFFAVHRKSRAPTAAAACPICGLVPSLYFCFGRQCPNKLLVT